MGAPYSRRGRRPRGATMLNGCPKFSGFLLTKNDEGQSLDWTDIDESELMDGDVTVEISHSSLNFKDGLAMTGRSPVVRRWPMVPGIDFVGTVRTSTHPDHAVGDHVILNGWGTGETHLGGYAEISRVSGDWLVPLPDGMSPSRAMAIGTAGYTAMLCVLALERQGCDAQQRSGHRPPVPPGASAAWPSRSWPASDTRGWHRADAPTARATSYGAWGQRRSSDRSEFSEPGRPLGKERFAAAVDSVGKPHARQRCGSAPLRGRWPPPAGWLRGWTCRDRWPPSFFGACRSSASTA